MVHPVTKMTAERLAEQYSLEAIELALKIVSEERTNEQTP